MSTRIPTLEEFAAFKGAHSHQLWRRVGPDWHCPCCKRSKFQLLRWTTRFPNSLNRFQDWMAVLHEHHDHSVGWDAPGTSRFPRTVICDQCNTADGVAKRRLKLPPDFSFSPIEIAQFVEATPHGRHKLKLEIATQIHRELVRSNLDD